MKGLLTCSRAIENKGLFVEPKAPNPEAVKVSGGKKKLVRSLNLEIGSPVYGLFGPETEPLGRKTKNQKRRITNGPFVSRFKGRHNTNPIVYSLKYMKRT